ncbi:MAG: hypothetical protein H8E57_06600 [Candidatus Cloacimonetes bacterium]|nr:hypothetical protein [Candidatus Cloacimonadota bacterium]
MRKIYLILFVCAVLLGCPKTPNTSPFDSLRDVLFSVDMNDEFDDGNFDAEIDTISIRGDFNDWIPLEMADDDSNGVYTITILDLRLGSDYEYFYQLNNTPEEIETRTYTVIEDDNVVENFYNVLIQTTVTMKVNMNYQIELGTFDPGADFVDIAGNINDWTGSGALDDADGDNIFDIFYDDLDPDYEMEFKFRINADWENSEFPGGGPNRTYTVVEGENIVDYWYNDEQPPK